MYSLPVSAPNEPSSESVLYWKASALSPLELTKNIKEICINGYNEAKGSIKYKRNNELPE